MILYSYSYAHGELFWSLTIPCLCHKLFIYQHLFKNQKAWFQPKLSGSILGLSHKIKKKNSSSQETCITPNPKIFDMEHLRTSSVKIFQMKHMRSHMALPQRHVVYMGLNITIFFCTATPNSKIFWYKKCLLHAESNLFKWNLWDYIRTGLMDLLFKLKVTVYQENLLLSTYKSKTICFQVSWTCFVKFVQRNTAFIYDIYGGESLTLSLSQKQASRPRS